LLPKNWADFVRSSLSNFKSFSYFLKVSTFNFKISFSIQFVRNAGLSVIIKDVGGRFKDLLKCSVRYRFSREEELISVSSRSWFWVGLLFDLRYESGDHPKI
jgi:hypothetical protein